MIFFDLDGEIFCATNSMYGVAVTMENIARVIVNFIFILLHEDLLLIASLTMTKSFL